MRTKKCFTCKEVKSVEDFYWHSTANMYRSSCKKCLIEYWGAWRSAHPKKARASDKLRKAVKAGKIKKPTLCSKCGKDCSGYTGLLNGHHEDYNFPLDITWLCDKCHRLVHKKHEICVVDGCENKSLIRGLCNMHHLRVDRYNWKTPTSKQ